MRLGERLSTIASLVPIGARLADIGTDHAYLPINLIQRKIIPWAVAGEVNNGPYQSASEAIEEYGLGSQISLRLGNGLAVLSPGEVDVVVIAGMGGATITDILTMQPEVTQSLNGLILQPMIAAAAVRRWLIGHNWRIADEAIVQEENKLYEIIAAEQGISPELEPILYEIGPVLWLKKPPLLKTHIEHLIAQNKRILADMSASANASNSAKYHEYVNKIKQLEAKLICL